MKRLCPRQGRGIVLLFALAAGWPGSASAKEGKRARAGAGQGVELGLFVGVHTISDDTKLARTTETEPLTGEMYSVNTTPGSGVPLGLRLGFRLAPEVAIE